jgi:phage tail sheath protein FI
VPVTTSFPGIYIQELPSSAHTIAAAPTSITVMVGYSHPFKTINPGVPVELFSFADYEREFGGFIESNFLDPTLPFAVNQFFLNGGTDAVVVGIVPKKYNPTGDAVQRGSVDHHGIKFTALEPTDRSKPPKPNDRGNIMTVAIVNVQTNIADITVTYGAQQEVFRKVTLDTGSPAGTPPTNPDFLETRINGVSALVTVGPTGAAYPADFTSGSADINEIPAGNPTGVFNPGDYAPIFQADSSLDKWPLFNILLTPGVIDSAVLSEAIAFAERKLAFVIMDPPPNSVGDPSSDPNWIGSYHPPVSQNAALYFPYIQSTDPTTGAPVNLPPSGSVAGIYARTDSARGVWKAPAGIETTILNTTGVVPTGVLTDQRHGVLNNLGIDCLRVFTSIGTVVFGARTLVYPNTALRTQWGYVPVRRMALFLEQTLKLNLTWVIFEPNDEPLWIAIRATIEAFMLSLFNQGAFAGSKPSEAFQVKCDGSTTTPDDVNNGIVNIIVAFAPLKPAEFVIIKIAQLAGQPQS